MRSGWKTFFTCCCCCCCLCPLAITPLAHNICVRLSREFSSPGHNLLSLPQCSLSQSLFPSLSRSSGGVEFEANVFFLFCPFVPHLCEPKQRLLLVTIRPQDQKHHPLSVKHSLSSSHMDLHHTLLNVWLCLCMYERERSNGQMLLLHCQKNKPVEKWIMSKNMTGIFSVSVYTHFFQPYNILYKCLYI